MKRIILILILVMFVMSTHSLHAMPRLWRKVCGGVISLDKENQTLTLNSSKDPAPLTLRLKESTIYIFDHKRVSIKDLAERTEVTLFYKNPLISSRFATRIIWNSKPSRGQPESEVCCEHLGEVI